MRFLQLAAFALLLLTQGTFAFAPSSVPLRGGRLHGLGSQHLARSTTCSKHRGMSVKMAMANAMSDSLYDPSVRDAHYNGNIAQHLIDLHDASATFDFCGGMMFQLVLSDKLRSELASVASSGSNDAQPVVHDASVFRMANIPGYTQTAHADNVKLFHGREVRKVPSAAGGMGMVLQLVSTQDDPEGWTPQEVSGYDGWGHDSGRQWRTGEMLEQEGCKEFRSKFGQSAFTLHHRFYLHLDGSQRMWLSAEDGCEGHPSAGQAGMLGQIRKLLG